MTMREEYDILIRNDTWALASLSLGHNIVGKKWVFSIKQNLYNSIARYNARLVAKGFHQQSGIDFHETFSPMINSVTYHPYYA